MTLFEECKSILSEHFYQPTESESKMIKLKLENHINKSLLKKPRIISIDNIISLTSENNIYVIADDIDIPVFETSMNLLFRNIYDVICLSTRIFFMSDDIIICSNFPHDIFEVFEV